LFANIIREMKPRGIKLAGHASRIGTMTKTYRVSVRKFHDIGRDRRIILKRYMRKLMRTLVD
jgi:hypothetical protein